MTMFHGRTYESPLEGIFDWNFAKYAAKDVTITPQVECMTMLGVFRPDFVITGKEGHLIAVELDGEEFHDAFRDECRDSILLGENHVDVIYRIKGKDIFHNTADMLYLMALCDPWMFTEKGIGNLKHLSCWERLDFDPSDEVHMIKVSHIDELEKEHFRITTVIRHSVEGKQREHWRHLYQFALDTRPQNLRRDGFGSIEVAGGSGFDFLIGIYGRTVRIGMERIANAISQHHVGRMR